MKRMCILLLFVFNSCDKNNSIEQPVELRFVNLTGMYVDSVFFNVEQGMPTFKVADIDIDETTDYIEFNSSYWPPLATLYIDSTIINHPRTDLVCCLLEGKYTIEFSLILDSNNDRKTSTFAKEDN